MRIQPGPTRRILAVITKEFREIIRDPVYLAMVFVVPVFIMMVFGYGLTLDVNNVPLGIYDRDDSPLSRRYAEAYVVTDSFKLIEMYHEERSLERDL